MADDLHLSYLSLLGEIGGFLEKLSDLNNQKTAAVQGDDLNTLNEILKQEQALALSLRGLEQKRLKLLSGLGLEGVPLSGLARRYPPALQLQAKNAAEELRRRYRIYQSAAEAARSTLEMNLHQIEKYLADEGAGSLPGPGYAPPGAEPPPAMKTDFRA